VVIAVVVLDACILISLVQVKRFDILSSLPEYRFVTTEHVLNEITDEQQMKDIQFEIQAATIEVFKLIDPVTMRLYFQLKERIGSGEASCIAIARENNWKVCSDDKRKVPSSVQKYLGSGALLIFKQLMQIASNSNVITDGEVTEIQEKLLEISRIRIALRVAEDL